MPLSAARISLLLLLLVLLCLPLGARAEETNDGTGAGTTTTAQAPSPPPAEGTPSVDDGQTGQGEDLRTLRHRYRQDPTGVRARLGMCRRGQGGPGGGPHHRYRGGGPWSNP